RDRNVTGVQTCALPISPLKTSWIFARTISPRGRGFSRRLFENLTVLALLLAAFSLKANLLDDFNDNTKTAWSDTANGGTIVEARSEERRVGKEGRTRWW